MPESLDPVGAVDDFVVKVVTFFGEEAGFAVAILNLGELAAELAPLSKTKKKLEERRKKRRNHYSMESWKDSLEWPTLTIFQVSPF